VSDITSMQTVIRAFECFSEVLPLRLNNPQRLTEGVFSFDFAISLAVLISQEKIWHEQPYEEYGAGSRYDFVLYPSPEEIPLAFEVKYFRPPPGGKNPPLPQFLGQYLEAILKARSKHTKEMRHFILLCSHEVFVKYLQNNQPKLDVFPKSLCNQKRTIDIDIKHLPATSQKVINKYLAGRNLIRLSFFVHSNVQVRDHYLSLLEVLKLDDIAEGSPN
jgi:hypothetical protein